MAYRYKNQLKVLFINMIHQVHGYKLAYEEQTGKKINKMYVL
jgi:hypothetical protein